MKDEEQIIAFWKNITNPPSVKNRHVAKNDRRKIQKSPVVENVGNEIRANLHTRHPTNSSRMSKILLLKDNCMVLREQNEIKKIMNHTIITLESHNVFKIHTHFSPNHIFLSIFNFS